MGPLSPEQLLGRPDVSPETYVWREGLASWMPLREVTELAAPSAVTAEAPRSAFSQPTTQDLTATFADSSAPSQPCSECSKPTPTNLMVQLKDGWVCANCRPLWEQKFRQAFYWRRDPLNNIGDFGSRASGYFWDYVIWSFLSSIVVGIVLAIDRSGGDSAAHGVVAWATITMCAGCMLLVRAAVESNMVAKKGGTVGHRRSGLLVVTPEGKFPTYPIAFVRSLVNSLCVLFPPVFSP